MRGASPHAKLLRIYIHSHPDGGNEGLLYLPYGYVIEDLGLTREEVEASVAELVERGLICYDEREQTVLDRTALELRAPAGYKQILGAVKRIRSSPHSGLLKDQLMKVAQEHCPDLARAIDEPTYLDQLQEMESPKKKGVAKPKKNRRVASPFEGGPMGGDRDRDGDRAEVEKEEELESGSLEVPEVDEYRKALESLRLAELSGDVQTAGALKAEIENLKWIVGPPLKKRARNQES